MEGFDYKGKIFEVSGITKNAIWNGIRVKFYLRTGWYYDLE